MRGNSRRLDVCLGDFAVSIQGFDDPLAVLEEVLRLGQRVIAESPDLVNSEAVFDEAAMTEVIERVARRTGADPDALGAVPGIVLVHRSDETDGGLAEIRRAASQPQDAALDEVPARSGPAIDATLRRSAGHDDAASADEVEADRTTPEAAHAEALGAGAATGAEAQGTGDGAADDEPRVVNIFGTPEPQAGTRRPLFQARSTTDATPAPPPAADARAGGDGGRGGIGLGDRFESLLAKVHGRAAEPDAASKPAAPAASAPGAATMAPARMSPAEVAAAAGAEDAQDALLSAAAFLTVIRRQSRFTRRELMAVFDEIPGEFPRTLEIQIKGIGKLTRNGSLRRVDDDHFGLSRELIEKFEPLLRA